MTPATFSTSIEAQQAAALLESYHFELGHHDARQWVSLWLEYYRPSWIRDAVVEALFQGRYKSISVRQILEMWKRRGQPIRHVTHDFEAAICREFGGSKLTPVTPSPRRAQRQPQQKTNVAFADFSANQPANLPPADSSFVGQLPADQIMTHRAQAVSFDLSASMPAAEIPKSNDTGQIEPGRTASGGRWATQYGDRPVPGHPAAAGSAYGPAADRQSDRTLVNSVLYSSARAIQPFKPALPFSAQTLRLARQKALADTLN